MILVDNATGSWELQSLIQKQGIACDKAALAGADACFEGYGPDGTTGIGVERKRIRDMLDCIDTGRYSGHQAVMMRGMYGFRFVALEGFWRPDTRSGLLLRGIPEPDGKMGWTDQWGPGMHRVMYYKLRRYLFSVMMTGVHLLYTRDIAHTAYDIMELYHYFQKPWHEHKSQLALHHRTLTIPTLAHKPGLVRRWAFELEGVGMQYSADAERIFKTPRLLANSEERDWMRVPGIGPKTAIQIVREIGGYRR